MQHPELDADGFCVLAALSTYADAEGRCRPSQATLARHLRRSRPWVNRVIAQLARDGFLSKTTRTRENGGTSSCAYRLALEPSWMRPGMVRDLTLPCSPHDAPRHADDENHSNLNHHAPAPTASAAPMPAETECVEGGTAPAADWMPSAEVVARAERAFPDVSLDGHAAMFVARCRAKGYRYTAGLLDEAWLSWFLEDARRERAGRGGGAVRSAANHGACLQGGRGHGLRERTLMPTERADARLAAWAAVAAAPRVVAVGPWA